MIKAFRIVSPEYAINTLTLIKIFNLRLTFVWLVLSGHLCKSTGKVWNFCHEKIFKFVIKNTMNDLHNSNFACMLLIYEMDCIYLYFFCKKWVLFFVEWDFNDIFYSTAYSYSIWIKQDRWHIILLCYLRNIYECWTFYYNLFVGKKVT